jgi:hypothetical protein
MGFNRSAAFAGVFCEEEETARFDHDRQLIWDDVSLSLDVPSRVHTGQDLFWLTLVYPHAMLITLVETTVRRMTTLEATSTRLEIIASPETLPV